MDCYTMKEKMKILTKANQARLNKQYENAKHLYINYLDNYNDDADVMWILAQVMYELAFRKTDQMIDLLEGATNWIKKAIDLNSDRAEFHVTLGKIFVTGVYVPEYEKATDCYRTALKLNPILFSAGSGLAFLVRVPEANVNASEVIAIMEKIAITQPDNQHIFMSLGYLYETAERFTEAQEMFKRAILCPEPLSIRYMD